MGLSSLAENKIYMNTMQSAGVLATEMECAQLFVLTALANARLQATKITHPKILSGAILSVIGDDTPFSANESEVENIIETSIQLGIETTKLLFQKDKLSHFFS